MNETLTSVLTSLPVIIIWTIGAVPGILMVKRGGNGPAKLFLTGCILQLLASLTGLILSGSTYDWIRENDISAGEFGLRVSLVNIPVSLVRLAGFLCLLTAFWRKFMSYNRKDA